MERPKSHLLPNIARIAFGSILAVYGADLLDELRRINKGHAPVWNLDTKGSNRIITTLADPLMKVFAGGIVSHHPDFFEIDRDDNFQESGVPLLPTTPYDYTRLGRPNPNFLDYALAHSIWGIPEIATLELDTEQTKPDQQFHYAFQRDNQGIWVSSKKTSERIKILIDKPLTVFALEPGTLNPLPVKARGPYPRFDPNFKNLRQF